MPAFVFAFNNKADQRHFLCWLHRLSRWEYLPYELAASVGRRASLYGVSWPMLTMLSVSLGVRLFTACVGQSVKYVCLPACLSASLQGERVRT